jgi:hypothetical protein
MKRTSLALLALLLFLTGCVQLDSLNPLYTAKDIVFDQSLVGEWSSMETDSLGGMDIRSYDGKTYWIGPLKNRDGNSRVEYLGHLVNMGGRQFLDLSPQCWEANANSYELSVKPGKTGTTVDPKLLKLGSASYMSFSGGSDGQPVKAKLLPAHWFVRVTRNSNKLRLDWINAFTFQQALQAGSFHITNMLLNNGKDVVITAETSELQEFMAQHGGDDTLFAEGSGEMIKHQ